MSWSDARSIQPEAQLKSAEKKTYTELASENGVGCLSRYRKTGNEQDVRRNLEQYHLNKIQGTDSDDLSRQTALGIRIVTHRAIFPLRFETYPK